MNEKCCVPNCLNSSTNGLGFPQDENLKLKWLESLELKEFVPTATTFVCLNHFGIEANLIGDQLETNIEDIPIPSLVNNIVGNSVENIENRTCSLCIKTTSKSISLTDNITPDLSVANAIQHYLPELGKLVKVICEECLQHLENFHVFRTNLLEKHSISFVLNQPQQKRGRKRKLQLSNGSNKKTEGDDAVEELIKVLEGTIPDDMKRDDNIIIQVASDDEPEENGESIVEIGDNQIKLPKGLRISVNHAKIGKRKADNLQCVLNVQFCMIDGYLFEFGILKGDLQRLKCVNGRCRSIAEFIIDENDGTNEVDVKIAHNHVPSSEIEMKQQLFITVMRRKLQNNKTIHFRSLYDQLCAEQPDLKRIIPIKMMINQICAQPETSTKIPVTTSFKSFYDLIEDSTFQKLHFSKNSEQFYQEKFTANDGTMAILFANRTKIDELSNSRIMYVDASFKINTKESFTYHLVTALVWTEDSFYPIAFALVSNKSQEIYKSIFGYLHDTLAPQLCPEEIITDYEACLYYSLAETYLDSHIGGSIFYYTLNLYKKICSLELANELEVNANFRNIYHMLLMLPLLPVNTIEDGLNNIELQASELEQTEITQSIFDYLRDQWMTRVTPALFCVHRLENRINENVIAPFKKLRDLLMLSKSRTQKPITIVTVVNRLIELEAYLRDVYTKPTKNSFARDVLSSQKKHVIRAWQFIECHPKININIFFTKVLGYIKSMENQLWIWGFYRHQGECDEELINSFNFSIVDENELEMKEQVVEECEEDGLVEYVNVVVDNKDGFLIHGNENHQVTIIEERLV